MYLDIFIWLLPLKLSMRNLSPCYKVNHKIGRTQIKDIEPLTHINSEFLSHRWIPCNSSAGKFGWHLYWKQAESRSRAFSKPFILKYLLQLVSNYERCMESGEKIVAILKLQRFKYNPKTKNVRSTHSHISLVPGRYRFQIPARARIINSD